jgi:hypothetical protein
MLIVAYAITQGSTLTGMILALVIAIGAAVTIGIVGSFGILLRSGIFGRMDPEGRRYRRLLRGLEIASSSAILMLGVVLLIGTLHAG